METSRAILMESIKELVIASGGQPNPLRIEPEYMNALTRVYVAISELIEASKAVQRDIERNCQVSQCRNVPAIEE